MKTQIYNLFGAVAMILLLFIGGAYKFLRKYYRRFCIKVLWKRFGVRTAVYHQWHDKRAAKLQAALDAEHKYATV